MVSIRVILKRYRYFLLFISLFMFNAVSSFAAIGDLVIDSWLCIVGDTRCCVDGKKTCCKDDGTIYDTSCGGACPLVGSKEYKYTASGCSYTTQTRTCCSGGSWSAWDGACPTIKNCTGTKPATSQSCYGGYQYRTVSCNTSTGQWSTGAWGSCDCSDIAFEKVYLSGSTNTCCQRKDGTGLRCRTDVTSVGWRSMGLGACNGGYETAVYSLSACGTCTEAMAKQYPSYQCCVRSTGIGPNSTTYTGYVCGY